MCGRVSRNLLDYKCPSCGKPLDIKLNLPFEKGKIVKKERSLWRYKKYFPYVKNADVITLGEGWTPLVKFSDNIYFKLENLNPTGSFKDRGSATLISALYSRISKINGYVCEDSSGNAGASIAAYSARAALKARIYVPETVSGPKYRQICFFGADVVKVSGSRSRVAEEAQKSECGKCYVGHILHPLFRDGIRSLAYEIAEQFDWHVPECVFLPVSAGTLLLGVIEGFKHMVDSDVIASMPRIVACQTRQVSPLFHRLKGLQYMPPREVSSVADALVSTNPPLLELMFEKLQSAEGDAVMVEEKEIIDAFRELAVKGFFVEPSSAVAYAGCKKQLENEKLLKHEKTVVILTGNGLKSEPKLN